MKNKRFSLGIAVIALILFSLAAYAGLRGAVGSAEALENVLVADLLAVCGVVILVTFAFMLKFTKPIEYKR